MLSTLIDEKYITQESGKDDKRQRLLSLTEKGLALERELTAIQKNRFSKAYKAAGYEQAQGFLSVMRHILDDETASLLDSPTNRKK